MLKNFLNHNKTDAPGFNAEDYSFWFGFNETETFNIETPAGLIRKNLPAWRGYKQYEGGNKTLILGYRKTTKGKRPVKYRLDYPSFKYTNNNILIIGSAGSGKTWKFVAPNIVNMNESYIITDAAGELYEEFGQMLIDNGYKVLRYDPNHSFYSDTYNPFDYLYNEEGKPDDKKINEFINVFFKKSYEIGKHGGDPFWNKSAKALMTFLVYYMLEFIPARERTFYTLYQLISIAKPDENSSKSVPNLDTYIANARAQKPDAKCFEYYDIFTIAPAKTRNAIVISLGVELSPFAMDSYRYVTSNTDRNINLYDLGNTKTALFIITSSALTAPINTVLSTMLIRHAQDCLFKAAELNDSKLMITGKEDKDVIEGGFESIGQAQERIKELPGSENLTVKKGTCSLPIPTRFILDAESNISFNSDRIAVARKYNISVTLSFMCVEQIQNLYNCVYPSELDCDICVFLGSTDEASRKYISHCLGNTLIQPVPLSSAEYEVRPLMTANMLGHMDNNECIIMIRGMNPMLLDKIQPTSEEWFKNIGSLSNRSLNKEWLEKHYPRIDMGGTSDVPAPEKEITMESLAQFLGITDKKQITKKEILHAVLDILEPEP